MQVPFLFKQIIDAFNVDPTAGLLCGWWEDRSLLDVRMPVVLHHLFSQNRCAWTLDGLARIGATLFGELLNATFANVGQRAIRKVARETFEHLLNLDLKFHLSRSAAQSSSISVPCSFLLLRLSPVFGLLHRT